MVICRRNIGMRQPGGGGGSIDVPSAAGRGRTLVKGDDEQRVCPIGTRRHIRNKSLQKGIALGRGAVVHIVRHVGRYKGKVNRRIKVGQWLYIRTLTGIQADTLKTDRRIVFAHILAGEAGAVDPARSRIAVRTIARKILYINAPILTGRRHLLGEVVDRGRKGEMAVVHHSLVRTGKSHRDNLAVRDATRRSNL